MQSDMRPGFFSLRLALARPRSTVRWLFQNCITGDFVRLLSNLVFATLLLLLASCGGGEDSEPRVQQKATSAAVNETALETANLVMGGQAFTKATPSHRIPENGWWWNPSEGGRGFAIEVQGEQIFMSSFLYEENGAATWYVSTLTSQADGSYVGSMTRYFGGQTLLGTYRSPTSTMTVATAILNFSSKTLGTLTVDFAGAAPRRTISLERFPISKPVAFTKSNSGFQSGWWWNESEGGRGYFIEVQGSQAFIGSFMYEVSGQPTWYVSSATLVGDNYLGGSLDQYVNGQSLSGAYKSPIAYPGGAGSFSLSFSSGNAGTLTLPNGKSVSLKRYAFNPSAPIYSIGVTVSGLTGTGLVLQNNGGDNLSVWPSGSKTFSTPVATGSTYSVKVLTQPTGQSCTVGNATGTVNGANVTNVTVSCVKIGDLNCTPGRGAGVDGVKLYSADDTFTYLLSNTRANAANTVIASWGALNTGEYYEYTGSLKATLWAVKSSYSGGSIFGYEVAVLKPDFFGPGAYSSNQIRATYGLTQRAIVSSYNPPPGQYCMVLTLLQYLPGACSPNPEGYCMVDWLQHSPRVSFQ
ncbi:hypothetical protein [Rhodoferax sp.]|uniref:hypothetical protein n=1 Tax=Rhodoferax sp. TaxID=50421 RepID=UPI002743DA47|nr:hypothetical protein [Rhodoferax sp.]